MQTHTLKITVMHLYDVSSVQSAFWKFKYRLQWVDEFSNHVSFRQDRRSDYLNYAGCHFLLYKSGPGLQEVTMDYFCNQEAEGK